MGKGLILVTGGAGYIGCVLVPQLLERGFDVRVYDKLYYGDEGLSDFKDKIEIVQGDLRNFDRKVLDGVMGVVHLAGLSNDPTANFNPVANYKINTVATEVLANACKERGIQRLTFASSCSIYDMGFHAEDFLKDENTTVNPIAPYSNSNFEAERILFHLRDDTFRPVSLRHATVYGYSPRMRFDLVVNTFIKDALTKGEITVHCGGEMWRPLIDVSDIAAAHVACLEAPVDLVDGQVFNLVHRNYRILELAHKVIGGMNGAGNIKINIDYSNTKSRSYRVSGEKIRNVLGYEPKVGVRESVENIMKHIRRENINPLHLKHFNIEWMTLLHNAEQLIEKTGAIY